MPRDRTADEQGIPRENSSIVAVAKEIADAVLRVTRRVQSRRRDTLSDGKLVPVSRRLAHCLAIGATGDGQIAKVFALRRAVCQPTPVPAPAPSPATVVLLRRTISSLPPA